MAISRRRFLAVGAAVLAFGAFPSSRRGAGSVRAAGATTRPEHGSPRRPTAQQLAALRVLGKPASAFRRPGSRRDGRAAAGTPDPTLKGIEQVVILMMENHSFDNLFGMLGRGDGFRLGPEGAPSATNPYANGDLQRAFRMPTTCQLSGKPTQEWEQAHVQYDGGRNQGFVRSASGPVSMGYWTRADLPFEYALATTFPIGDRWFSSLLGQTDPNRMFLFAGTSMGLTDDFGEGDLHEIESWPSPPNGTIFNALSAAGVSWKSYTALGAPPRGASPAVLEAALAGATPMLWFENDAPYYVDLATLEIRTAHLAAVGAASDPAAKVKGTFFADAAAGTLPQVSMIDPNYALSSQEDPQNIVVGEAFLASIVHALAASPQWDSTLLVITYDEWGGWFDHVPPPLAMAPDDVGPRFLPAQNGEHAYDGFSRYGFRVPSVVVSPYAKRDHVSSMVHDHTSVLALLERKWNLPALTFRDANANDLTDFVDLDALRSRTPTFTPADVAAVPPPGDTAGALRCSTEGPGRIPPPGSVIAGRRGRRG